MTAGIVVAALLAVVAFAYVVAPLFRRDAAEAEERSETLGLARELQSRRDQLLGSLKDLEDDHATDKIDASDYETLKTRLSAEAVQVMRELDVLEARRKTELEAARRAAAPVRHPSAKTPDPAR